MRAITIGSASMPEIFPAPFVYALKAGPKGTGQVSVLMESVSHHTLGPKVIEPKQGPLKQMRDFAEHLEWTQKILSFAKVTKDMTITGLLDFGPRDFSARFDEASTGGHEPPVPGLFKQIRDAAREIITRKTVFVVSDQTEDALRDQIPALVGGIGKELNTELGLLGDGSPWWTFVRFAPARPKRIADRIDVLGQIVNEVLMRSFVGQSREQEDFRKPGPVLLEGPTGTGKSLAAELFAQDRGVKFVPINLSAISRELLESRMRGYEKGAFTGAIKATPGWFEEADGGVLFLDELQSVAISAQTHLLDLLSVVSDDVTVSRMGTDAVRKRLRVKVFLAVNEPIEQLLMKRRLRNDLFFRIRSVVRFPTLATLLRGDAPDDKKPETFLRKLFLIYRWKAAPELDTEVPLTVPALFPRFEEAALSELRGHEWAGNFRELERLACDLYWQLDKGSSDGLITAEMVREELRKLLARGASTRRSGAFLDEVSGSEFVVHHIERVLRKHRFIVTQALPELEGVSIRSRYKLAEVMKQNIERLSPDVVGQKRVRRFLRLPG